MAKRAHRTIPAESVQTEQAVPAPTTNETTALAESEGSKPSLLKPVGGSEIAEFNVTLLESIMSTLWLGQSDEAKKNAQLKAVLATMKAIAPADEVEAMFAAQMVATHHAALEAYRRAMMPTQPAEGRAMNLSQANKLVRSFAVLSESLAKYRGKGGEQTVKVEHRHVHVNAGGQAVIAEQINTGGTGAPAKK
jgi:hypothetical protein